MSEREERGPVTAGEAEAHKECLLRTDPEYRDRVEAVEAQRRERVRVLHEAEPPIVADLRGVGLRVGSVWDPVNTSEPYPEALPKLLDHLKRGGYRDRVMESLAGALAVKPSLCSPAPPVTSSMIWWRSFARSRAARAASTSCAQFGDC